MEDGQAPLSREASPRHYHPHGPKRHRQQLQRFRRQLGAEAKRCTATQSIPKVSEECRLVLSLLTHWSWWHYILLIWVRGEGYEDVWMNS